MYWEEVNATICFFIKCHLSVTVEYKPYKSAYARDTPSEPAEATSYRCDVCCKDFNGPQPFAMHMKSKAHKEELEAQEG